MKITKGKRLVVHFGCLSSFDESQSKAQDDEKRQQLIDDTEEKARLHRTKIIEGLNRSRDVQDVSDLFAKPPLDTFFNPIFFRVHLPLSLQKHVYGRSESDNALTEDFECAYDGGLLFIAALCDIDKYPYGAFDVKDRVCTVLESITKIKTIPPCLYASPVVFALENDAITESDSDSYFRLTKATDSKNLMRELYEMVGYELNEFYEMCSLSYEISERTEKIENNITILLDIMCGFSRSSWKKRLIGGTSERRKDMIKILAEVSRCQSDHNLLEREMRDFKMFNYSRERSPVLVVLELQSVKFYATPYLKPDTASIIKTLELVRSELDSRTRNRYALLSAFTGAIVGSIVTLLLSHI